MSPTPKSASPAATPSSAPLSALRGLLPFLRPYRARVALAFVLLCLGSAAILVVPLAFRDLIDAGFGSVPAGGEASAGVADGGGLFGAQGLDGRFVALFGLAVFWAAAFPGTARWLNAQIDLLPALMVYASLRARPPKLAISRVW